MARVYRLQAKGLGKFAAAKIAKNIRLLTTLIKEFEAYDIKSILDELPPELKPEKMQEVSAIDNSHTITNKNLMIRSVIVLGLVILGFVTHDITHLETCVAAMLGASVLLLFEKPDE